MAVERRAEAVELAMAGVLAGLAGAVDAIGYLRLQHLYVSFMSGTTTQLGVAAGRGDWAAAGRAAPVIGVFVVGVVAGGVMAEATGRWHRVAVLVGVAAVLGGAAGRVLPMAPALGFAMGGLNAAMHRAGAVNVSLTYVTGTLVKFGQGLGRWLTGRRGEKWGAQAVPWVGILAGAVGGAWLEGAYGVAGLWGPVGVALAVAGWAATLR